MATLRTHTGKQLPAENLSEALENLEGAAYWLLQGILAALGLVRE